MKKSLRLRSLILLFSAFALLSGCGKEQKAEEPKLLLGFSQIGSESSFRIGNTRDIEEKAE